MENIVTKEQFHDHTIDEMGKYKTIHESIDTMSKNMISRSYLTTVVTISGIFISLIGALLWYIYSEVVITRLDKSEKKIEVLNEKVDDLSDNFNQLIYKYDFDISKSNESTRES